MGHREKMTTNVTRIQVYGSHFFQFILAPFSSTRRREKGRLGKQKSDFLFTAAATLIYLKWIGNNNDDDKE